MNVIHVDIVDSEKSIFVGDVEYLVVEAHDGELAIYPHHIALISKLKAGLLRLKISNEVEQLVFAISGGFLEVSNNKIIILADIIERTDHLDEIKLIEQKNIALHKLNSAESLVGYDIAKTYVALDIAIAQLKAVQFLKHKN